MLYVGKRINHPVSNLFPVIGLFFAMTYGESRKRIFTCQDCKQSCDRHTVLSTLFLFVFWIQILVLAGVIGLVTALLLAAALGF